MTLAVWLLSALVALAVFASGLLKIAVPRTSLAKRMKWAATWSDANVKLLGVVEVLGAIGLIVPAATGILPMLTPIAAIGIAVLMAAAVKVQIDLREPIAPALVLCVACLGIAAARLAS
jgi:uncharacterized membrane protein